MPTDEEKTPSGSIATIEDPEAVRARSTEDLTDETAPDNGDPESAESTESVDNKGKRRRPRVATVFAGLLALLLIAGAVVAGQVWNSGRKDEQRGAVAVDTARQMAVKLVTVNAATADQDVREILNGAVGDFGKIFSENLDSYVDIVRKGKVETTGDASSSGLEKLDGSTARVLVAVKATVKNDQVPQGEERNYRMSVEMIEQPDGRWLAQKVDFVP